MAPVPDFQREPAQLSCCGLNRQMALCTLTICSFSMPRNVVVLPRKMLNTAKTTILKRGDMSAERNNGQFCHCYSSSRQGEQG